MNRISFIFFLSIFSFSPFFAKQAKKSKACSVQEKKENPTLSEADFNLTIAATANDVEDTEEALKADGVHINAKDEVNGNTSFAIAAHNFIKAIQEGKKQNKVAAAEIMKRLLEHGAKPVTVYYIESPTRGRVKQDMSDNVELQFLIQKYSARRMSI